MAMRGFVQLVYTRPVIAVAIGSGYLGLQVPRHDEGATKNTADQEEAYLAHVLVCF